MIVYVESNFVLELAFLQEEYESCLELLHLAESEAIHLVLPAFSVGEPYEVWVRRSKQRRELRDQLRRFFKKNFPYEDAEAGRIKISHLGSSGWRSKRFSTARMARLPSAIPF